MEFYMNQMIHKCITLSLKLPNRKVGEDLEFFKIIEPLDVLVINS